jgi:hypothetical protein
MRGYSLKAHHHHLPQWIRSFALFDMDALPSLPGTSTISSPLSFVVEGVFRKSGVVHSFKVIDPGLLVYGLCRRKLYVPGRASQTGQAEERRQTKRDKLVFADGL